MGQDIALTHETKHRTGVLYASSEKNSGSRTFIHNPGMSLGSRLKALREELGMTQDQVAKAIKRSQKAVSLLERGDRDVPNGQTLQALAGLFDVEADWLLTGRGQRKPHSTMTAQEEEVLRLFRALSSAGKAYYLARLQDIYRGEFEEGPSSESSPDGDGDRKRKEGKRIN